MKVRMELRGAAEAEKALGALGEEIANVVGRAAVRAAANQLRDELRTTAPYAPGTRLHKGKNYGHLKDNIRTRREKERKAYAIRYVVNMGRAYWAYFREMGTARQPARPWAAPTFDRMKERLLDTMMDTLKRRTDAAARRLARKGAPRAPIGRNGGPELED